MKMIGLVGVLVGCLFGQPLFADVQFIDPWVRQAPPGAQVIGGYLGVYNNNPYPITLTGVSASFAKHSMIHQSVVKDGMATMLHHSSIDIAAGATLMFKPGSYHLMFMQPDSLRAGDKVTFELYFANGRYSEVEAVVKRM